MEDESIIQEILKTESEWVEAHRNLDLTTIERIMADSYQKIQSNGSVINKQENLASYSSANRMWENAESDQYIVRIYGNSAVVIGRWQAKGENDGQEFDYTARFMSIYVKHENEWKMVAEQSTPILEKEENTSR